MSIALKDKVPYIRYPNGSKDEIMFTAKNVNMYEDGNTVQKEIEDLKELIGVLTETVAAVREENETLRTALEGQMNSLRNSLDTVVITREKIIDALGFEPSRQTNITVFQGAKKATASSAGQSGTTGIVPAPSQSEYDCFLCADGTWKPIGLSNYLTKSAAELLFLGLHAKADSAYTADVANTAYNVPYTAKGNIWIRENNQ